MRRRRKADVPGIQCDRYFVHEGCTELPDEPATEGTADDDVESGSAAGEASSEALDAQGAGDSQTAAEEPLTESEAASTANNYVKPAQGTAGSTQEQAAE